MFFHNPTITLLVSYSIPLFTFGITYLIAMQTPRIHAPFHGNTMWVHPGDYHLSTSISHGLARRLGSLGLSLGSIVFLFVVLHKVAYMHSLIKKESKEKIEKKLWLIDLLRWTGISSSIFMIFVCCFPESEGLLLHLLFALLYFGTNIAYQQIHLAVDEIFHLDLKEPKLHLLRKWCSFIAVCCLFGVIISLSVFDNMILSSALEVIMVIFMLGFFSSLHSQYANIRIHPYIIAIEKSHRNN